MLKGFNYPLTPKGKSTLNPPPPWYYSADFLNIEFWSDPAAVAAVLPPGLDPDPAAEGHGNALFYDWQFSGANDEYLDPVSNGQQTLGVALPWGIASCLVRPNEKTLSISGDGGFLFSAMELETAVRLKLNLVHMVWINGTYDMVAVQEQPKYKRTSGVDFGPVDVVKYAEAFGAAGFMIGAPDQIGPTLKTAFDIPGPVLIGIRVDYRDNHKLFEKVHEYLIN